MFSVYLFLLDVILMTFTIKKGNKGRKISTKRSMILFQKQKIEHNAFFSRFQ